MSHPLTASQGKTRRHCLGSVMISPRALPSYPLHMLLIANRAVAPDWWQERAVDERHTRAPLRREMPSLARGLRLDQASQRSSVREP